MHILYLKLNILLMLLPSSQAKKVLQVWATKSDAAYFLQTPLPLGLQYWAMHFLFVLFVAR